MSENDKSYEVPFGEPWETIAALAKAAWLEPADAAEVMRTLAELGYRVVPVRDTQ